MCHSKDPLNKKELEIKVKNYKKVLLKLTRNSKANHFNNFFRENKLNLFKHGRVLGKLLTYLNNEQQISHLFKLVIKQLKIHRDSK